MFKKIILSSAFLLMLLLFVIGVNAVSANITSCTLNIPTSNYFDDGTENILVNATAVSNGTINFTVDFIFGTTTFSNITANGTETNFTGGLNTNQTALSGDFTFTIDSSSLSGGGLTTFATCYDYDRNGLNSSSITYTVDLTNPSIILNKPNNRQTVAVKGGGFVTFEYTPTDVNLGNSTMYLDGQPYQSSTSGTSTSNITTGVLNRFKVFYSNNNLSRNWIVEITDLAGRKTNSSQFNFNVFARGAPEAQSVFVTPSGEVISSPAQPKGRPLALGNIGDVGSLLSNPLVWGSLIVGAVGLFIWWQNRKR